MLIHSNKWGKNTPVTDLDYQEGIEFAKGDDTAAILLDTAEVPAFLKALRRQRGLTQTELGKMLYPDTNQDTAKRVIAAIESGSRKLGLSTLSQIVDRFGLKLSLAISGFEEKS